MKRYEPNIDVGLTEEQVQNRINDGLVNHDVSLPTKSIKQILFENFFTLFNSFISNFQFSKSYFDY